MMKDWCVSGQRVVCVNDNPVKNPGHPPLELRCVYTIAEVHIYPPTGEVCIGLVEHPLLFPTLYGMSHWLWEAYRFRPVRDTSIEQFRSFLNPSPVCEMEDA